MPNGPENQGKIYLRLTEWSSLCAPRYERRRATGLSESEDDDTRVGDGPDDA